MGMAIHTGNARSLSLWLPTIAIVIFFWSFLYLNSNVRMCTFLSSPSNFKQLPSVEHSSPSSENVVQKKPSALDREPLRIYIPSDELPEDNPLYDIPGLHHEASSPPATYPKGEGPAPAASIPNENECHDQSFDISKCPSIEQINEHTKPSTQTPPSDVLSPEIQQDRPLILYAYSESDFGRINLAFFVNHGLHDAADFIFILNGETDVDTMVLPAGRPNVRIIKRENTCFDLGAHAEVLTEEQDGGGALKDRYKRFILMNASIRGPFVPHWSKECWSDAYLGRLNEKVKVRLALWLG